MNQNLIQMAQLLKGKDPQQMVMNMLQSSGAIDPRVSQLVSFVQNKDMNSFVNLATSMFAQEGLDLNEEFASFMELMK